VFTLEEYVFGTIYGVVESKRLIAIKDKKRINFYYMSKSMFKQFMLYFNSGIFIFMQTKNTSRIYRGYLVKNVVAIDKIISPNKNRPTIYYDISIIKSGIKSLVNQNRNRLFMDFEMSMPPYNNYETFVSEIIQAGYILTDETGSIVEKFTTYLKPKLFPEISIRTKKFLHIEQEEVNMGETYECFHNRLLKLQKIYNPVVYVWGKNDQLELNKLNKLYNLRNFTKNMQFVDLLSLHKIYYGLKNDIGLFNAYKLYADDGLDKQKHDALEDASVTKDIFYSFKEVCNNQRQIEFK